MYLLLKYEGTLVPQSEEPTEFSIRHIEGVKLVEVGKWPTAEEGLKCAKQRLQEWLNERYGPSDSVEALNIANQTIPWEV